MQEETTFTKSEEIEWKFQSTDKDGKYAIFVPYVNARALMEWLDRTFDSWDKTSEWLGMIEHDQSKKGTITTTRHNIFRCTITARKDGEVQIVDDMAESSDIEPVKGGSSDAFKRAGTNLGFGRDLYKYPTVRVELKDGKYPGFKNKPAFEKITELFAAGKVASDMTLWIDLNGNLYPIEYGKPVTSRPLLGVATAEKKEAVKSKEQVGIPAEKFLASHSESYTLDHINANLYEGGVLAKKMEELVMKSWKAVDGRIHHKAYIQAFSKNDGKNMWFKLNNYQLTRFKSEARE